MHLVQNLLISGAYLTIAGESAIFAAFAYRQLPRPLLWLPIVSLTGGFVLSCAGGHAAEALEISWVGSLHFFTGSISWAAAVAIALAIPQALNLVAVSRRSQQNQKDLMTLFDASIQGIAAFAPVIENDAIVDFEYVLVNEATVKVLDRNPTGERLLSVYSEQRNALFLLYKEVFETKVTQRTRIESPLRGETRYWEIVVSVWSNDRILVCFSEITKFVLEQQRLEEKTLIDPLTQIYNRTVLKEIKAGDFSAVLFIDLNRFKQVNDVFGHQVGDELLKGVAQRLVGATKVKDVVCRVSGDEFLVLLSGEITPENAMKIARRLADRLEQPFYIQGHTLEISASIGIAIDAEADVEVLSDRADTAMYRSKYASKSGRYEINIFEPEMKEKQLQEALLEQELKLAIAGTNGHSLILHYQPIFDLQHESILNEYNKALIGFEALVRWQHPDRGLVYPDSFISLAERTGLIDRLFEVVFSQACEQANHWNEFLSGVNMSVNVSTLQVAQKEFPIVVCRIARLKGLAFDQINLEITEGKILESNQAQVNEVLEALSRQKIKLSIDDFGTGASSFARLGALNTIDYLKLDRSLMPNPSADTSRALLICKSMVHLAHALKISVVAEGLETVEQVKILKSVGCDLGQGYYFCKPESAEAIEQRFFAHLQ